ncbi:MAG: hypothetical protein V1833_01605, partial [Elusimicrobiota bacterium]
MNCLEEALELQMAQAEQYYYPSVVAYSLVVVAYLPEIASFPAPFPRLEVASSLLDFLEAVVAYWVVEFPAQIVVAVAAADHHY